MNSIPEQVRQLVMRRAHGWCEYCLLYQDDTLYAHEVGYIIPKRHRGLAVPENLCCACLDCNRYKGSDFASFDPDTDRVALLFHPRRDKWRDHFQLSDTLILPLSDIGRVTIHVLRLNDPMRIRARMALHDVHRYPLFAEPFI
jgi:hypothetical protein